MTIQELRQKTGLSQSKFAEQYHINKGTLAQWEQGRRKCPDYVLYILEKLIEQEYKG